MLKADRDQVLGNLQDDDRSNFRKFINDYQVKLKSTSTKQKPVGEMGPHVGTVPPDFNLKRMGSEERVRLSSFKGQKAVALIFGSYT